MSYMIKEEVQTVVNSMGYHLVEMNTGVSGKTVFVILYVHKNTAGGLSSQDCDQIIFALKARVESIVYPNHLSLSVSSPGLNRILKNKTEYPVFVGRKIHLYLCTGNTVEGILSYANENHCTINEIIYTYEEISKGKLIDCI